MHLPLVLPRSDAGGEAPCLVVGGEAREWALGRALVFDDSFTHEVRFPQGRAEPGPEQAAGGECAEEGRWEALLARLRLAPTRRASDPAIDALLPGAQLALQ